MKTEKTSVPTLELEGYAAQKARWPVRGNVILAQYDDASIVVYQAFHRVTAEHAVEHQRLGGPRYSLARMSWIKPNFLWMMYRCGWLTKDEEQGRVLAIWIARTFFDEIVEGSVASKWDRERFETREAWERAGAVSDVRLQWDPDHAPDGAREERRAIQLGLRGATLARFVNEATVHIRDVSELVVAERAHRGSPELLRTPKERVYDVGAREASSRSSI